MEFRGRRFKSKSGQVSIDTSNNHSLAYTICMSSFGYTHMITSAKPPSKRTWRPTKAKAEMKSDTVQKMNWICCTKLSLSAG